MIDQLTYEYVVLYVVKFLLLKRGSIHSDRSLDNELPALVMSVPENVTTPSRSASAASKLRSIARMNSSLGSAAAGSPAVLPFPEFSHRF